MCMKTKQQSIEKRVADILQQMTIEEKAGMMFINGARINEDGSIEDKPAKGMFAFAPNGLKLMDEKKMNHFNLWQVPSASMLVKWYNAMQKYAEEKTRLGIPITIASDPRNHFSGNIFAMAATDFSQWCEPLGFAAIGDEKLMWQFADRIQAGICGNRNKGSTASHGRSCHRATLAPHQRNIWRGSQLSAKLIKAYVLGLQGNELGATSVAAMTKHFSGGGPQKEGLDPHFPFSERAGIPW